MNDSPRNIFVSLSGGADSLALLLMTLERGEPCRAVHFEHGFRGKESLEDAAFCKRFCKKRGIPIDVISLDVPHRKLPGEGDEEAARRLRLEAWKKITENIPGAVVLLGHHADDAAETLFLRLFRGSNASGLAALRPKRIIGGITFERPLLDMARADIEAYLRRNGVRKWCVDSTNRKSIYLRNYLRNEILPEIKKRVPYAAGGIRRAIQSLTLDAEYLERAADAAFDVCKDGNVNAWKSLDPALLPRVLRRFLPDDILPDLALTERLYAELHRPPAPGNEVIRIPVPGNVFFLSLHSGRLSVERIKQKNQPEEIIVWDREKQPEIRWKDFVFTFKTESQTGNNAFDDGNAHFDGDELPRKLRITCWHEGDTILSFDGHRKNLKKLFCDRHVSGGARANVPILRTEAGDVLFVPGFRTARIFAVGTGTKRITTIFCKKR